MSQGGKTVIFSNDRFLLHIPKDRHFRDVAWKFHREIHEIDAVRADRIKWTGFAEIYQSNWHIQGFVLFRTSAAMTVRRIFFNVIQFLSLNKPCKNRVHFFKKNPEVRLFVIFLDKKILCVVPLVLWLRIQLVFQIFYTYRLCLGLITTS